MKRFILLGTVLLLGGGMAMTQDDSGDIFKKLDKNGDGKLVASEIPEDQSRFFDRLVRIGDSNDDGELSRSEYDSATSDEAGSPGPGARGPGEGRPGGSRPDASEFLNRMDRNKDGKISLNELPEFVRGRMGPIFKESGKDALTFAEFAQARQKLGGRPGEGRPGEGRPGEGRPREGRDGDRPPRDGDRPPGEGRPGEGRGPGGGPAFFRILDANRDGKLSRDELAKATSLIDELDQNDDGQLDGREMFGGRPGEGPGGRPGEGRPPRDGDRPPREGDRPPREGDDRPGERPRRPQAEGDRPQGEGRRQGEGGREGSNLNENFRRLDKNGDGSVSKEEAPDRLKENFSRVDSNGDGKVTIDELRKIFERARQGGREKPADK